MNYTFEPYDVLQINRTQTEWQDFATLRIPEEASRAVALVDHLATWEGHYMSFRIVRQGVTVYRRVEVV